MALRNNKSLLEQSLESAKAMVPTVEAVVEAVVDAAKDGFESAKDVVENASEKAASGVILSFCRKMNAPVSPVNIAVTI